MTAKVPRDCTQKIAANERGLLGTQRVIKGSCPGNFSGWMGRLANIDYCYSIVTVRSLSDEFQLRGFRCSAPIVHGAGDTQREVGNRVASRLHPKYTTVKRANVRLRSPGRKAEATCSRSVCRGISRGCPKSSMDNPRVRGMKHCKPIAKGVPPFSPEDELRRKWEAAGNIPASIVDASNCGYTTYSMISRGGGNCTRSPDSVKSCRTSSLRTSALSLTAPQQRTRAPIYRI